MDNLDFGASPFGVTLGRAPGGTGAFRLQSASTLGSENSGYINGSLILNEILYNPDGSADLEYLELYNPSSTRLQLSDWKIDGVGDLNMLNEWTVEPVQFLCFEVRPA